MPMPLDAPASRVGHGVSDPWTLTTIDPCAVRGIAAFTRLCLFSSAEYCRPFEIEKQVYNNIVICITIKGLQVEGRISYPLAGWIGPILRPGPSSKKEGAYVPLFGC